MSSSWWYVRDLRVADGYPRHRGECLLEQLQPLCVQILTEHVQGDPGHVAPRTRQAGDQTQPDRILRGRHDDRDRGGSLRAAWLGAVPNATMTSTCCWTSSVASGASSSRRVFAVQVPGGYPGLEEDVLPLDPAQVPQPVPKGHTPGGIGLGRAEKEKADLGQFARRLRIGDERRSHDIESEGSEEGHHRPKRESEIRKPTLPHWIRSPRPPGREPTADS